MVGTSARPVWTRAVLVAMATTLLVTGCGGADGDSTAGKDSSARPQAGSGLGEPQDPGFGHVHGLGTNPADGTVYAATHYGVFRLPDSGVRPAPPPTRVADRWQDTMGFVVAGPDLFYASGHPDMREPGPPHMGLIVSRDRAETWQPVSLRGEADFHDLATAGKRIYGFDSTSGLLMVSTDAGRTWSRRKLGLVRDVTVDPADPATLLATGPDGLLLSADAGRTARVLGEAPQLLTVDWSRRVLAGADPSGVVWLADGARPDGRWRQRGRLAGAPQAFTATADGRLLAADDEGVKASDDRGRTWSVLATYEQTGAH